jgi:hypothetical protein
MLVLRNNVIGRREGIGDTQELNKRGSKIEMRDAEVDYLHS